MVQSTKANEMWGLLEACSNHIIPWLQYMLNDVLGGCVRRQITVLAEMWKSRVKSLLFDSTKQRARPTFHKKF